MTTSAREVAELILKGVVANTCSIDEVTEIIGSYGAVCGAVAAKEATSKAYDRCIELIGGSKKEAMRMITRGAWKLLKALDAMPMNVGAAIALEDHTRSDIVTELLDEGYAVEVSGVIRITDAGRRYVRQESNSRRNDDEAHGQTD